MDEVGRASLDDVLGLRARVLRPGQAVEAAVFPCDAQPDTRHWAAWRAGGVVAVATVAREPLPEDRPLTAPVDPRPGWQLRGMAVDGALQGTGVGRRLLDAVVADVGAPLWCNARLRAVPFYARAGWRVVSDRFEVTGIGPHHRMVHP